MTKYADWIVRWRWAAIFLSVLLFVLGGTGLEKIQFSGDYRDFFQKDDPQLRAYQLVQDAYSNDSSALVVFAPEGGTVFEPRTIEAVSRFTEEAWRLPFARRVDSLTNFQHAEAQGDDLVVRQLLSPRSKPTAADLAAAREIALNEPLLVKKLVSPKGHVTGVNISFTLPKLSETEIPTVVKALREQIAQLRAAYPEIQIKATGGLLLDNAFDEQAQADLATLTPLMYGLILVVMFFALRSALGVLATLFTMTFSVFTAVGAAGLLGIKLTAISVSAPTILMTIAIANCLHIAVYVLRRMGTGDTRHDAVKQAVVANVPIMAVACGTDALGFFSMCLSSVPPIASFGLILGVGAVAVFVFSAVFLPAFLAVLPLKGQPRLQRQGQLIGKAAARLIDYRGPIFIGVLVLNVAAGWFVMQNKLEDNFVNYFSSDIEFRRDTDFVSEHLSGVHEVLYSVPAKEAGGVADVEYLQHLDRFTEWLRSQPEVFNVTSLSDVVKRIHRTMNGGEAAAYRIPADSQTSSQMLLLFEMSLPPGLELSDQIRIDRSASKLSVVVRDITSAELLAFDQRVQEWTAAHLPAYMKTQGTGPSIMFSRIGEMNVAGTLNSYVLQILLISAVICVLLRSVRLGIASLLPNVMPSLLAFGLWGFFVGQIGLSVAVVAVLTYGIIVDDTIHSIFKYHHARKTLGMEPRSAVEHAYGISGMSVLFTTAVLVAGFCVLTFSSFDLNADLGVMSALTIGLAALVDLLILPPLLYTLDSRRAVPVAAAAAAA
jgi:predicted RND superfamily exporter protein